MSSISPIADVLSAPSSAPLVPPANNNTDSSLTRPATQAAQTASPSNTPASALSTTAPLTNTPTQPLNLVFDALATAGFNSVIDETIFAPPTAQASGAFSIFMDQLFTALAAQQAETARTKAAQSNAAGGTQATAATLPATATAAAAATAAATATATAAFTSNAASVAPNSALESDVQALANQAEAANPGISNTTTLTAEATNTLLPLQQSFDELIASLGGTPNTAGLPTFLGALANNLHTVPSPLGNLVDSLT